MLLKNKNKKLKNIRLGILKILEMPLNAHIHYDETFEGNQ